MCAQLGAERKRPLKNAKDALTRDGSKSIVTPPAASKDLLSVNLNQFFLTPVPQDDQFVLTHFTASMLNGDDPFASPTSGDFFDILAGPPGDISHGKRSFDIPALDCVGLLA